MYPDIPGAFFVKSFKDSKYYYNYKFLLKINELYYKICILFIILFCRYNLQIAFIILRDYRFFTRMNWRRYRGAYRFEKEIKHRSFRR